ncbi:hypothetical protein ACQ4WX_03615 [Streptomyces lasalocidi]
MTTWTWNSSKVAAVDSQGVAPPMGRRTLATGERCRESSTKLKLAYRSPA